MIRDFIIFSPAIILAGVSFICLILGLRELLYIQKGDVHRANNRIEAFMIMGCLGSVGTCTIFAGISSNHMLFFSTMIVIGWIILCIGESLLYRDIVYLKKNAFAPWVVFEGILFIVIPLPVMLNLHEPFTFIYIYA